MHTLQHLDCFPTQYPASQMNEMFLLCGRQATRQQSHFLIQGKKTCATAGAGSVMAFHRALSSAFALPCTLILTTILQKKVAHRTRRFFCLGRFTPRSLSTRQCHLLDQLHVPFAHAFFSGVFDGSSGGLWLSSSPFFSSARDVFTPCAPPFSWCVVHLCFLRDVSPFSHVLFLLPASVQKRDAHPLWILGASGTCSIRGPLTGREHCRNTPLG